MVCCFWGRMPSSGPLNKHKGLESWGVGVYVCTPECHHLQQPYNIIIEFPRGGVAMRTNNSYLTRLLSAECLPGRAEF